MKKLIENLLKALKTITRIIEETYEEVYSEVEKEFYERVNQLKEFNKKRFIKKVSEAVILKCYQDTRHLMPPEMAEELAKELFEEAIRKGDVDMLGKLQMKGDK